jgi:chromosome partitioning protein
MGFVISVSNLKGGVAKTSTCIGLGRSLAKMGQRVLLVDLDPQADLTLSAGLTPKHVSYNARDLFLPGILDQVDTSSFVVPTAYKNLQMIASNGNVNLNEPAASSKNMRAAFWAALRTHFVTEYDYILIDCPPSLGPYTLGALTAADLVIIPTQAEFFSANSLLKMMKILRDLRTEENPDLRYKVLVTLLDLRNRIQRQILDSFRQGFKENMFETCIELDTKIRESQAARVPIVDYKPASRGALKYMSLAAEVLSFLGQAAPAPSEPPPTETQSEREQPLVLHCPFLGHKGDPKTVMNYPSGLNVCHRARTPSTPKVEYQKSHCLTNAYLSCPLLASPKPIPMPKEMKRRPERWWEIFRVG